MRISQVIAARMRGLLAAVMGDPGNSGGHDGLAHVKANLTEFLK
jgi:hypothetical protein